MASLKDNGDQVLDHTGGQVLLILLIVLIVTNVVTFVFARKKYSNTTKDDQEKYQKEHTKSTKIFKIRQTVDGMDMTQPHDTDIGAESNPVLQSFPPIGNGKIFQARKQEVEEGDKSKKRRRKNKIKQDEQELFNKE